MSFRTQLHRLDRLTRQERPDSSFVGSQRFWTWVSGGGLTPTEDELDELAIHVARLEDERSSQDPLAILAEEERKAAVASRHSPQKRFVDPWIADHDQLHQAVIRRGRELTRAGTSRGRKS